MRAELSWRRILSDLVNFRCGPQKSLTLKPHGRRDDIRSKGFSRSGVLLLEPGGRVGADFATNAPFAPAEAPGRSSASG